MFITSDEAIQRLRMGDLVAIPTETVYGLAADATRDDSVKSIYRVKNRPTLNPLIVHIAHPCDASRWALISPIARRLIEVFWKEDNRDKPLTLVLPLQLQQALSPQILAGLSTVALRFPTHPIARTILTQLSFPLAMPSANRSETISPTEAQAVLKTLAIPVVDGGPCAVGIESTILSLASDPPLLLRKGAVLREELESILGKSLLDPAADSELVCPGMMKRHYAPSLPLRLNAITPQFQEAFIAFGPTEIETPFQLSLSKNLQEAASRLFRLLHVADQPNRYQGIAVMPIPMEGIGSALNDRLERAASP
jgi:L-threonylcarbamoyladenylate synthase